MSFEHPMTLQELSVAYAKKQPHDVNYLLEESPILAQIKFEKSSHPLNNVYEETVDVKGAAYVDLNAPLPEVNVETELKRENLSVMGGELFVAEDQAQIMGGTGKYFAKKTPSILRKAGNDTEKKFFYDMRKRADDFGHLVKCGAAAGSTNCYSIVAIRWIPGENCGLYSPEGFASGAMLDVKPINGGAIYKDPTTGVLGYGIRYKGYFGLQVANPKGIAAICNINDSNLPTPTQLDEMLDTCRANSANTFIYMHRALLTKFNDYKWQKMMTRVENKNMDRTLTEWDGIKIITSYNLDKGTETAI